MKNKKLLIGLALGMLMIGNSNALAQEVETQFSEESPHYILVMWGQENLAKNLSVKNWMGSIKSENAEFAVAKEILVGSGEKLENSQGDLGVLGDDLAIETSSKYRKGVILRLFEKENQDGSLQVEIGDFEKEYSLDELNDGLDMGMVAGDSFLEVKSLQDNDGLDIDERNRLFRNKLTVLKSTIGIEGWANEQFDQGKISLAVAESLKANLDNSLAATFDNDAKVAAFEYKYARVRNLVNQEKIAPGVAAGAIQRLIRDAQN